MEFPCEEGFKKHLVIVIDRLLAEEETLHAFRLSGGKIEIYLQLPGSVNNGDTIDSMFLKTMGELGIDLLIEVFPGMK